MHVSLHIPDSIQRPDETSMTGIEPLKVNSRASMPAVIPEYVLKTFWKSLAANADTVQDGEDCLLQNPL